MLNAVAMDISEAMEHLVVHRTLLRLARKRRLHIPTQPGFIMDFLSLELIQTYEGLELYTGSE